MENVISYSSIVDINNISRWDAGHKFCFRITIADGSLLLQVSIMVIMLREIMLAVLMEKDNDYGITDDNGMMMVTINMIMG